jgi:hypothetical protein
MLRPTQPLASDAARWIGSGFAVSIRTSRHTNYDYSRVTYLGAPSRKERFSVPRMVDALDPFGSLDRLNVYTTF